jgi:hypothetical protein
MRERKDVSDHHQSDHHLAEEQSQAIFQKGMETLSPPPFLAARVRNELKARQKSSRATLFWKALALSGLGLSMALSMTLFVSSAQFEASTGSPTLVEISVRQIESSEIAKAEIRLPAGVTFYSEAYPDLNDRSIVEVPWESLRDNQELPFVIRSKNSGVKTVRVRFYSESGRMIEERSLKIRFVSSKS